MERRNFMTDNGEINRLVYSYSGPDLMPMLEALLREQACRRHQDTIMTTIPDDIMRVADNIANERFALGLRVENVQELSDAIADAILAERERAERYGKALAALDRAAKSAILENDMPNRVIFKDGFVVEGRAADEWLNFLRRIIDVCEQAAAIRSQS